eukprot:TRINITY_DN914_c0_g1_i1.p1 TRINITY_DN914_c0_g1~~TRINITY_DN914_c0_g1_i1.p1  ORF type:complete len:1072 (+),score=141.80 TRINITY_DN914_c0_g1_i1:123-3338(+)
MEEYESFSDWEALQRQSADEGASVPEVTASRPLSFVLVEDEHLVAEKPHQESTSDERTKRKISSRRTQQTKKRRTHQPEPNCARKSTTTEIPQLDTPNKPTHHAVLDIRAPVYDQNDRIPRHNRRKSSPLRSTDVVDLSTETEHVFPSKPSTAPKKTTAHSGSLGNYSQHLNSRGSRECATIPAGALGTYGNSTPKHRRAAAGVSKPDPVRSVSARPTSRGRKVTPDTITSRLGSTPEPTDSAVHANTHIPLSVRPDRAAVDLRRNQQRRHSAPLSATQHEHESIVQSVPNHQKHSASRAQEPVPSNTNVHGRSSAIESRLPAQDSRIPFGLSPSVVGGPPFPPAFAVPTVPQGGPLSFVPPGMRRPGTSAPDNTAPGASNPHFGLGGPHLAQYPDNRVHALSPDTIIQMSRIHPPTFVPMPPMTAMMGYQGQLPIQPNFLAVPQMPMHPFLQSPGANMFSHSVHFNPALAQVPASRNPFPVNPSAAKSPDHGGAPRYSATPTRIPTNPEFRVVTEGTICQQTKQGSQKRTEKQRIISDLDHDEETNDSNEEIGLTKNKKQPAKKQPAKKNPDTPVIEVDEIPCDDEDDGTDYVSRLNQIPQKKKFCTLLNPRFEKVHVKGGGTGWKCTMMASLQNKSSPEVIETSTVGRNKSRAKKAAAKEILSKLEARVPELYSTEPIGKQNIQAIRSQSALNVLNQLVREGHLPSQPNCETEEVNDRDEDRWRCSAALVTKDHGRKVFAEYGSSKSNAKQKWARKALELLIELKSPGAEQFRCVIEPRQAPTKKTLASVPKASQVLVRTSDDEVSNASCDDIINDMDLSLELPSDYELVVAKTELDCEKWFEAHAQPGAELGAFIDSKLARLSVDASSVSEQSDDSGKLKRPILCFSTATSCIVIRIDERQESENKSNLDLALDKFWIPEAVARVLEDPRVQKTALECDDGVDVLCEDYGVQCESVQDIAVSSLAIAGYGRVSDSQDMSSLRDLTKYWMRKEAKAITWEKIWPRKHLLVEEWLGEDCKEVAIAVLSAYATFCVRERVSDAARVKRMNTPGAANDLEVLSRRIIEIEAG